MAVREDDSELNRSRHSASASGLGLATGMDLLAFARFLQAERDAPAAASKQATGTPAMKTTPEEFHAPHDASADTRATETGFVSVNSSSGERAGTAAETGAFLAAPMTAASAPILALLDALPRQWNISSSPMPDLRLPGIATETWFSGQVSFAPTPRAARANRASEEAEARARTDEADAAPKPETPATRRAPDPASGHDAKPAAPEHPNGTLVASLAPGDAAARTTPSFEAKSSPDVSFKPVSPQPLPVPMPVSPAPSEKAPPSSVPTIESPMEKAAPVASVSEPDSSPVSEASADAPGTESVVVPETSAPPNADHPPEEMPVPEAEDAPELPGDAVEPTPTEVPDTLPGRDEVLSPQADDEVPSDRAPLAEFTEPSVPEPGATVGAPVPADVTYGFGGLGPDLGVAKAVLGHCAALDARDAAEDKEERAQDVRGGTGDEAGAAAMPRDEDWLAPTPSNASAFTSPLDPNVPLDPDF